MSIMFQFVNDWSMNEKKREWRVLKRKRILSNESTFRFIVTKLVFVCCFVVKNWKKKSDDVIESDSKNDDDANESKKKKTTSKRKAATQRTTTTQKIFRKKVRTILDARKKKETRIETFFDVSDKRAKTSFDDAKRSRKNLDRWQKQTSITAWKKRTLNSRDWFSACRYEFQSHRLYHSKDYKHFSKLWFRASELSLA